MRDGWEIKPLGKVCEIFGRIGFRGYNRTDIVDTPEEGAISLSPSNISNGKLTYEKPTYISWAKYEESPEIKIENEDVLLVKTASVGKCAIVRDMPHPSTINPQIVVFKNIKLENAYLNYFLQSENFKEQLIKKVTGVAVPTTSQKSLSEMNVYYPKDKKEQLGVVEELDQINALISIKEKQLRELEELEQTIFHEMFGECDYSEGLTYGSEFVIGSGGTPKTSEKAYWEGGSIPWIGSNLCQNNILYETDGKLITEEGLKHSSAKLLDANTVLVALVGATIGKVALLKTPTATNQNIAFIMAADNSEYTSEFVYYHLMSQYQEFQNIGKGNFKMANQGFVRSLNIFKPSYDLQVKFSERIKIVEEQKANVIKVKEELQELLASRMQYWFD